MTQRMERFILGGTQPLGDNEIGVIAASSDLARDGHVLEVAGLSLANYKRNPIVLWSHNPDEPIGACTAVGVVGDELAARIELSDASTKAQEIRALAKGGVVKGISIGFDVLDAEPLNPAKGTRGGMRITSSELLEISLVAIGADTNALVVARGYRARPGASALLRSLPSLSAGAIAYARAQIGRAPVQHRPVALMPDHERMALYQRERSAHVMTVWGLQHGERERERDYSLEQRQADLRALGHDSTH